ncbi:FAD/FMN-containing dehydrogenase [Candidatus Mancarchaeum acidiphilum]|uniref:FAD/FMN-containing dehydrogenase n=1 Tax=Candidatus Mancarchaeum acidiphilum TaxID=1920749 RepID=A0A218NN30_9ARCH|nr:FAD-binding oxidoreductase [Candidatus Mancarchaeum acidiphilum]ASI13873.1 FAD/FMN-containing dehydrogenase [Candidatus Mancarchaeum acidiphilum]
MVEEKYANFTKGLVGAIGAENVLLDDSKKEPFRHDASDYVGEMPIAVCRPGSTDDVSKVMKLCYDNDIKVVARDSGTGLTGCTVPVKDSIVLDLTRMNKVLEVNLPARYVVTEPYVVLDDLNAQLAKDGFFYPPDPASSKVASVGGSLSTNAGGMRAVSTGVTRTWVLGIEVVLANGKVLQLGSRTVKDNSGYNLTQLIVGSEGTLAIITKAILHITPIPEATFRIGCYFKTDESNGEATQNILKTNLQVISAEFLGESAMAAIKRNRANIPFPEGANAVLMVDIASQKAALDSEVERAKEVLSKSNPVFMEVTTDPAKMADSQIFKVRQDMYYVLHDESQKLHQSLIAGDVTMPTTHLIDAIREINALIDKYKLNMTIFGHIGDGNIHHSIIVDLKNPEEAKKADDVQREISMIAVKYGGSMSAEHGIGYEKKEYLKDELKYRDSLEVLDLFRGIKKAFDPKGMLNPGKIFDLQ